MKRKKIKSLLAVIGICVLGLPTTALAQTSPEMKPRPFANSTVGALKYLCPFNATTFGSNAGMVVDLIPPKEPLKVIIDVNLSYDTMKNDIDTKWYGNMNYVLMSFQQWPAFYNCAQACYNLEVPLQVVYRTNDNDSIVTTLSLDDISIIFDTLK